MKKKQLKKGWNSVHSFRRDVVKIVAQNTKFFFVMISSGDETLTSSVAFGLVLLEIALKLGQEFIVFKKKKFAEILHVSYSVFVILRLP